jgi:hypothetical protein
MLGGFFTGFGFLVNLAICSYAVVLIHWAVRAKAYYWAAGSVLLCVVSSPLVLTVKIFLLMGMVCTGILLAMLTVFRPKLAPAVSGDSSVI